MVCTTTCFRTHRYALYCTGIVCLGAISCNFWLHDISCHVCVKLKLLVRDSKGQAHQTLEQVFLLANRGCVGFIGPGSSAPTIEASNWLSIPSIDRALISYSATSPKLSGPRFKNFLRTPPSDVVPAKMMATLMKGLLVML